MCGALRAAVEFVAQAQSLTPPSHASKRSLTRPAYFGGIGEPLFHPRTVEWVAQAKAAGARVELITNGTLLTEKRSRQLIDAGLDLLWVSIDGASPLSP